VSRRKRGRGREKSSAVLPGTEEKREEKGKRGRQKSIASRSGKGHTAREKRRGGREKEKKKKVKACLFITRPASQPRTRGRRGGGGEGGGGETAAVLS